MKAVSVVTIKKELKHRSSEELTELCLRLSKFKKENKELLTYLLFESHDESGYIETVKAEIDEQFEGINTNSYFYIKKSVRKILRNIKKLSKKKHVKNLCENNIKILPKVKFQKRDQRYWRLEKR